jgi:hypothetical protein
LAIAIVSVSLASLRSSHLDNFTAAKNTVGLFNLQISKATHRLGRARALRGFLKITAVALCGTLETVFKIDILYVRRHLLQLCKCALLAGGRTGKKPGGCECNDKRVTFHHSSFTLACACVARS